MRENTFPVFNWNSSEIDWDKALEEIYKNTRGRLRDNPLPNGYNWDFDKDGGTLTIELPGVDPKDTSVSLDDGNIVIMWKDPKAGEERGNFLTVRFGLDDKMNGKKSTATMKNGLLSIYIPCKEKPKPKKIDIKVG